MIRTREEVLSHPPIIFFKMIGCIFVAKDMRKEQGPFFSFRSRVWFEPRADLREQQSVILHVLQHCCACQLHEKHIGVIEASSGDRTFDAQNAIKPDAECPCRIMTNIEAYHVSSLDTRHISEK